MEGRAGAAHLRPVKIGLAHCGHNDREIHKSWHLLA